MTNAIDSLRQKLWISIIDDLQYFSGYKTARFSLKAASVTHYVLGYGSLRLHKLWHITVISTAAPQMELS